MSPRLRRFLIGYAVPALAFLAIVMALNWRVWTGIAGARKAYGWDAVWAYWGYYEFQLDSWASGELPLWCPWDRLGYPFHADPQSGVLYPVTWLILGLGAIAGAKYWLVTVVIMFHFWWGGVGMYAFLRRRGLSRSACYAGGVFFILTYPWTHAMFSAINWGMAHAPWMLLAVDWWAERPERRGRAAAVALTFALGQLAGAPAAFWYSLCVVVPYGTWAVAHHARASGDWRAWLRRAAPGAGLAFALFVLMVAGQLTATSALVEHTVREARDLNFIGITAYTPDDMVGMIVPRMPGEGVYISIVGLFAVAAAASLQPSARRYTLLGVAVFGALCAWGDQIGVLPQLATVIPPFSYFRRAHRYLYVTMVPLAILAAEGLWMLAQLEAAETRRRVRNLLLAGGAIGLVIFGSAFVRGSHKPNVPEPFRDAYGLALVSFAVSTWALVMLVSVNGRWRAAFGWFAAAILFFDIWNARFPQTEKNFFPIPKPGADAVAKTLDGVPAREARIYDREWFKYRPGIRLQVRDLGGYEGDPLNLRRYEALLKRTWQAPALLGHANVRWLTEGGKSYSKPTQLSPKGLTPLAGKAGIYEVPQVAPAVYWTGKVAVAKDAADALNQLVAQPPGATAVVERGSLSDAELASLASPAPPVAGRFTRYERNRVTAEVEAPAAGVVVIHEAYYPGWSATVDGKPARIIPVNSAFRGVVVEPGAHVIELSYKASGYKVLALFMFLAFWASVALLLRDVIKETREPRREDDPAAAA